MTVPYPVINNTPPWTQAIAGAAQTIFSTDWTANVASDIVVYNRLPSIAANDALQIVDPSLYTVQFIGNDELVQVTFVTAPLQFNIVTIMRNTPADRLNLYTNANFTASMLNADIGTLTLVDQQNEFYWNQNIPRYNNSETLRGQDPITGFGYDLVLPPLAANQFWVKEPYNRFFIAATLPSGTGDLPITSPIVTYGPAPALTGSFDLGTLTSGILAQTVALGISTPYIAATTGTGDIVLDTNPSIASPTVTGGTFNFPTLGTPTTNSIEFTTNLPIFDLNGNLILALSPCVGTLANWIGIGNAITGNNPVMFATGNDTNVLLQLSGKGNLGVGLEGSIDAGNAITGNVGQIIQNSATAQAIGTGTTIDVTSVALTPGDWLVYGSVVSNVAALTITNSLTASCSTTSATVGTPYIGNGNSVGNQTGFNVPIYRISISSNTTVYLCAAATYINGTLTLDGNLFAVRFR